MKWDFSFEKRRSIGEGFCLGDYRMSSCRQKRNSGELGERGLGEEEQVGRGDNGEGNRVGSEEELGDHE